MVEQPPKEEIFSIIRALENEPASTQRVLSQKLGISLGKINYLLKALIKKGFVKAKSFSKNPEKMKKIHYLLTEKGFEEKMRLAFHFLKVKEAEYSLLKKEWEKLSEDKTVKI